MTAVRSDETMARAIKHAHRYHDWVFSGFRTHLRPGSVLEVGSGHGCYARLMAPLMEELIVSDIDPRAVESLRAELAGLPNVRYLVMDGIEPGRLGRPVDNIVLVNVLEHIQDDAAFIGRCRESLAPGGVVVVFAPAFQCLYGRMDAQAGHYRRYSRTGLRALLEGQGLRVIHLRHFNAVGFFGWLVNKWLGTGVNASLTNAQVSLYDKLVPALRHMDRLLPFIGQSLVAVATSSR
ncbi:MAG: class I SAM-dependent methyltransferase [Verrucomicrobia bacterium]|nr:class I SAM-dependent methyltransferase [Verrucomicrobiota bacterium]